MLVTSICVLTLRSDTGVLEGSSDRPLTLLTTQHEIPKQASVKTGRISLTFRQLV